MTRVRELCFQVLGHLARVEEVKQVVKLTGVNSSQVEERVRVTPSNLLHAKHLLKESAARGQDQLMPLPRAIICDQGDIGKVSSGADLFEPNTPICIKLIPSQLN